MRLTNIFALIVFILAPSTALACTSNLDLPDSKCTPGAVLTTDLKTICVRGYTKTVRNVTLEQRLQIFKDYRIPYSQHKNYELDHLIALEIGGSNDNKNLFPERLTTKYGALIKDTFENYLHQQICTNKMTVEEAQKEISTDWLKYYLNTKKPVVKAKLPFHKEPIIEPNGYYNFYY